MAIAENISQHLRRRHSELDNIFQVRSWMQAMQSLTKGKLDPTRGIDIVKYATILGNPMQPLYVEPWLRRLLDKRPPTFQNKLDAICTAGVNLKFFTDQKVCY